MPNIAFDVSVKDENSDGDDGNTVDEKERDCDGEDRLIISQYRLWNKCTSSFSRQHER